MLFSYGQGSVIIMVESNSAFPMGPKAEGRMGYESLELGMCYILPKIGVTKVLKFILDNRLL